MTEPPALVAGGKSDLFPLLGVPAFPYAHRGRACARSATEDVRSGLFVAAFHRASTDNHRFDANRCSGPPAALSPRSCGQPPHRRVEHMPKAWWSWLAGAHPRMAWDSSLFTFSGTGCFAAEDEAVPLDRRAVIARRIDDAMLPLGPLVTDAVVA